MSILTLWVPAYGIEAITKGVLALISVGITAGLLLLLPRILVVPSRMQLQLANAALEEEIRHRRKAEAMVLRFQEIEATESQVRQAQKMEAIGQLTGGVAHDFNNILTVITGTIEILADAVKDRPHLAQITDMISAAAARGADLTQHLLAFSRRQPLQPRSTDVNALVIDAARLLRPTLGEQIEIESMLAHDSAPALIDPSQLSTAILNLALNARDAMPDGGKLTLETKNVVLDENYASMNSEVRPGNYVMVAVSDTGEGIPGSLLDKVFEPFFTTKDVGKGSGLGLSMVYGFVKQSNGHIKIYSEEGHGTTVKLYLPQAAGVAEALAAEAGAPGTEYGEESILIVEDDALVREYVVTQISRFGYHTLAASNAAEGAGDHRWSRTHRSAVHRRDHARRTERPAARDRSAEATPRAQGALHVGLYRKRHRASWPARRRRAAAAKTLSQLRSRTDDPHRAGIVNSLWEAFLR